MATTQRLPTEPSGEELAGLRVDALEDRAFRKTMRASATCFERWEREHRTSPGALLLAVARLARLFPRLEPDANPTRGDHFPLL